MRIGSGFDVHAFSSTEKQTSFIMGGVIIPHNKSLIAHSDGDVLLHCLIDSLLGSVSLGDIGLFFSSAKKTYKNIDSRILLRKAYDKVKNIGYCISNTDITIIAEYPIMTPYIKDMRINISKDLSCSYKDISIKSTTTEKLGFVGRTEGIACHAITLVQKI
ncbi:2-C-methyl-D-erythritol 2,4-cyclodiphosphate synthase [Buchnera aphidicola (Neophyllaphis podocarpi)]|uniref:2-C-methyl-D-erythritol 2,4-cyclodiphosphate synthase n=1 Tax=Buchnera aphidicola TaxID=9 RepID=UPI0031B8993A